MRKRIVVEVILGCVVAGSGLLWAGAQEPKPAPGKPAAPVAQTQNGAAVNADAQTTVITDKEPSTIRATTRLVQMSVVVTDKKGQPVTGLKKEDFTVLDESKPQQVEFFTESAPPASAEPATRMLPKNVFTNRYDLKGEDPGAVTIILFDAENTATEDQLYLRKQVMALLRSLKSQDHVAVYALTSQLLVLHDFTQDDSALVDAVAKFAPREQTVFDASFATRVQFVGPSTGATGPWQNLGQALETPNRQISNQFVKMRVITTTEALKAIANHVASIPGRKSLLWVSGGFPIQIGVPTIGRPTDLSLATEQRTDQGGTSVCADMTNQMACPEDETGTFDDQINEAVRELNRANVAIYPVDAHGVAVDPTMDVRKSGGTETVAVHEGDQSNTTATIAMEQDNRDSSKKLADGTGGVAFFGTNDVRNALQRAFDDSRYAYTIGFYPNHGNWNGAFRKIKVEVKAAGAKLRYRNGYFADAEKPGSDTQEKMAIRDAAASPLEATTLAMIVSGRLAGAVADRKVEVHVGLDPKQLLFQAADNHQKGAVDLYFVQRNAQGETLAAENQRIGFNLEQKQYDYLTKEGIVLARHLTIAPQATELRVLVRDAGSEVLGSVNVPVAGLFEGPGSSVVPAKMEKPK
ncbi:MAG TPA: VWA domain-containing protein [Candidatus Acidoferrum sp.]